MNGNKHLRTLLEEAAKLRLPAEYKQELARLKNVHHHAIQILPSGEPLHRYNCFSYALGLPEATRYRDLYARTCQSAMASSDFVQTLIDRALLTEVSGRDVQEGDVAVYFGASKPTHAAVLVATGCELLLHSKWGPSELHAHRLWEVQSSYGDEVRFYTPPTQSDILDELERFVTAQGHNP